MQEQESPPTKNKILKSLTLPGTIADKLKELSTKTGCTQSELVRIAICELYNLENDKLVELLTEYNLYW